MGSVGHTCSLCFPCLLMGPGDLSAGRWKTLEAGEHEAEGAVETHPLHSSVEEMAPGWEDTGLDGCLTLSVPSYPSSIFL